MENKLENKMEGKNTDQIPFTMLLISSLKEDKQFLNEEIMKLNDQIQKKMAQMKILVGPKRNQMHNEILNCQFKMTKLGGQREMVILYLDAVLKHLSKTKQAETN
jgi:hypothetical protein